MLLRSFKKALLWGAFLFLGTALAQAQCQRPEHAQVVRIGSVVDGDTLYLEGGSSVRLIGINTPEIGRDGKPSQPWAQAARQRLQALSPDIRYMVVGQQARDRYGRTLAHLYLQDGRSVEAVLLEEGLGFYIAIPPNLSMSLCLQAAEQRARMARRGVWRQPLRSVREVLASDDPAGFHLLRGSVTEDAIGGRSAYLALDGAVALRLGKLAAGSASIRALQRGDRVEVRGWLIDRGASSRPVIAGYPRWMISISHPDQIKRIP